MSSSPPPPPPPVEPTSRPTPPPPPRIPGAAREGELPVSLEPAGTVPEAPTEPPTLIVEPAPAVVSARPATVPSTAPVEPDLPIPVVEPDLPDLFSDGHVASTPLAPAVAATPRAGGGFLPPPALVPADAPDLPMSGASTARTNAVTDPSPIDDAASAAPARGRPSKPPKVGKAPKAGKPTTATKPGKRGRPAWLVPALGAAAVVAGGIYIVSTRSTPKPSSAAAPTTARAAVATSAAPTTLPVTTTATTVATTTATTAATVTTTTVAETTVASPATTQAPAPTTVAATTPPPPPAAGFPPPTEAKGTGNRTFKLDLSQNTAVILDATHKGSRNFIVKALDAKGGTLAVPINQVGAFAGSVILDPAASLQVTADGAWSMTVRPLLSGRQIQGGPASGKGSEVVIYAAKGKLNVSHSGQRTFSIELRNSSGVSTIVNEVGAYQGTIDLPDDVNVLGIVADGAWALTPD